MDQDNQGLENSLARIQYIRFSISTTVTLPQKMDSIQELAVALRDVSPSQICQVFFVFASVTIITIQTLPTTYRQALMDYGARLENDSRQSLIARFLDCLQVPHSWFLHFYILSVSLSAFWGWQYVTRGAVLRDIASAQVAAGNTPSMDISQVYVAWALMALQGTRRLHESLFVTKSGSSPMSSLHWLLGLLYYASMSVSVWVEGSGKSSKPSVHDLDPGLRLLSSTQKVR